jgi:tRNA threonylcarbamoyladenosine biosynthesis protein TsaB
MRVLALDTATATGGAALLEDERVLEEGSSDLSRSLAEQLPAVVIDLLGRAGLPLSAVDLFAVAAGPGSFTGLRIGIATMQGLAFVTGRRMVAVSVLEALAHVGAEDRPVGAIVAAWMDARRREVFSALYRVGEGRSFSRARVIELDPPTVDSPRATLARWAATFEPPTVFVGDGAAAYSDTMDWSPEVRGAPPLAPVIGRLAVHRAREGEAVEPGRVQPLYVRRPDAEIARDALRATK